MIGWLDSDSDMKSDLDWSWFGKCYLGSSFHLTLRFASGEVQTTIWSSITLSNIFNVWVYWWNYNYRLHIAHFAKKQDHSTLPITSARALSPRIVNQFYFNDGDHINTWKLISLCSSYPISFILSCERPSEIVEQPAAQILTNLAWGTPLWNTCTCKFTTPYQLLSTDT